MTIQKKCKKCDSTDLVIIIIFPQCDKDYLYCSDCLAFQKFLSKKDAKFYKIFGGKTA